MTKEKWKELYEILEKTYSDFSLAYPMYQNGSNKQKRKDGEQKIDEAIFIAKHQIEKYPEVYELITDGNPFLYDEFFMPKYFKRDMLRLLSSINEKIESID